MRSRALAVAALAGLAVAACGEEAAPRKPASATRSPLERRDAPPAGVAKQISYFALGDGCPSDHPPIDFLGSRRLEIAQTSWMCLNGFAPRRPIDVSVARSDGSVLRRRVTPSPSSGKALVTLLDWGLLAPGDPLGRYRFTARQGTTSHEAAIDVAAPTAPRLAVAPAAVTPGASVRVLLAGYGSEEAVRVDVYAEGPPEGGRTTAAYRTSLSLRVDSDGQLATTLRTPHGRGERRYVLTGPAKTRAFLRGAVRPAG